MRLRVARDEQNRRVAGEEGADRFRRRAARGEAAFANRWIFYVRKAVRKSITWLRISNLSIHPEDYPANDWLDKEEMRVQLKSAGVMKSLWRVRRELHDHD